MTNFLSSPNRHQGLLKTATLALVGAVACSPLAACSAPRLQTAPGDIVCSGEQHVPVKPGDTFGELVRDHVNTEGTIDPNTDPSKFAQEVKGITFQLGEVAAGRAAAGDTFVIKGSYDVLGINVTAGGSQLLPAACVKVDQPNNR